MLYFHSLIVNCCNDAEIAPAAFIAQFGSIAKSISSGVKEENLAGFSNITKAPIVKWRNAKVTFRHFVSSSFRGEGHTILWAQALWP